MDYWFCGLLSFSWQIWESLSYLLVKHELFSLVCSVKEGGILMCKRNQHSFLQVSSYSIRKQTITRVTYYRENTGNTHSVCSHMAYVQMLLVSIIYNLWVEGRLMLMLMLNLIKLQHALGAFIPNYVIYIKYTV